MGSDPVSTLAGRPAVYCKVQTIPSPFKFVTQKTIQAADIYHNHKESKLPLNEINITMGWKRLLGMARNAPRDLLPQSSPNTSFALAGDAVGLDVEVLRIVLAKAHNPVPRNQVYSEVQTQDLMNTFVRQQSMPVLMKGAVNSMSEAAVQTARLSGESVQNVGIPTSVNTLLLSGAGLPWRALSNQAQKEATRPSVTAIGHSTTRQLPDVKTMASAPVDILETVCDVAREVMGTPIDTNAPMMSAGLDSLSATEFTSTLSE